MNSIGRNYPKSISRDSALMLLVLIAATIAGVISGLAPVGLLILGGVLLFWIFVLYPSAILVTLAVSSAFPFYAVIGEYVFTLPQLVVVLGLSGLIIRSIGSEQRIFSLKASQLVPSIVFFLCLAASGIAASDLVDFVGAFLKFTNMIMAYILVMLLLNTGVTRAQFVFVFVTLSVVAAVASLIGFMWSVLGLDINPALQLGLLRRSMAWSPFGNANAFAAFIAMMLPLSLVVSVSRGRWSYKGLARGAPAVLLLALLATGSRSGLVAASAACVAVLALGRAGIATSSKWRIGALLLGAIGVFWMLWSALDFGQLFQFGGFSEHNVASRLHQWLLGLRVFQAYPIAGIGLGNVSQASSQTFLNTRDFMRLPIVIKLPPIDHFHSTLITLVAETGILGLGSFALVVGVSLRNVLRASRAKQFLDSRLASGVFGAIVAFMIGGLFEYYFTGHIGIPLFALLGLAASFSASPGGYPFEEVPK